VKFADCQKPDTFKAAIGPKTRRSISKASPNPGGVITDNRSESRKIAQTPACRYCRQHDGDA